MEHIDEIAGFITTKLAASILGVNRERVIQLIREGRVRAKMWSGDVYMVERASVEHYKATNPGRGRPRKQQTEG